MKENYQSPLAGEIVIPPMTGCKMVVVERFSRL
jgi:hypothetical protein